MVVVGVAVAVVVAVVVAVAVAVAVAVGVAVGVGVAVVVGVAVGVGVAVVVGVAVGVVVAVVVAVAVAVAVVVGVAVGVGVGVVKFSKIYLKAAKRIDAGKGWHCCTAIGELSYNAVNEFAKPFEPKRVRSHLWFGTASDDKNQNARVIALLFAAEIAKGEGR